MSLIMRPTGLGSGVDKDIFDYSVLSGDWPIGRIYERRGFSPDIRWEWSVHGIVLTRPPRIRTNGSAASLEEAKAEFQKSWDAWKAWAKLKEID